jgi:acyl-coenzyme A synthetase/AMP-(fatty) acid ligase
MSPRNTAAAIIKMMKETGCHKILTTQHTLKSLLTEIKAELAKDAYDVEVVEMPPLYDIYPKLGHETPEDAFEEYPPISVRPDIDNTMLYLHSSGSTGFPKSIRESFRMFCHWASMRESRSTFLLVRSTGLIIRIHSK